MTDYEYAQAVMTAAGVKPSKAVASWVERFTTSRLSRDFVSLEVAFDYLAHRNARVVAITEQKVEVIYPDPLASADDFLALWDALEAKGWWVDFSSNYSSDLCRVETSCTIFVDMGRPVSSSFSSGCKSDRRVALVEAAGRALGVTR